MDGWNCFEELLRGEGYDLKLAWWTNFDDELDKARLKKKMDMDSNGSLKGNKPLEFRFRSYKDLCFGQCKNKFATYSRNVQSSQLCNISNFLPFIT